MTTKTKSSSRVFMILILTFVLPFIAAWLAYSHGMFLSSHTVNRGVLLSAPINIHSLSLHSAFDPNTSAKPQGKWWLMYVNPTRGDKIPEQHLYEMRQIRQATGKNRERVNLAIITVDANYILNAHLKQHYPNTQYFVISLEQLKRFEDSLPKKLALEKGSLYLVDPLGNIMMYYAPEVAPKGILKDLERLLKVSQIG